MKCRHCSAPLNLDLIDLGSAPPSNAYLTHEALHAPEKWFPLRVLVCESCWLAQTEDFSQADELFSPDYAYFSSFSSSWLAHSERYVEAMVARFQLDADSHVVEVAANDGYLLQYFLQRGVPCMGIEPTASTAAAARKKGIDIVERFFGVELANDLVAAGRQADLMAANNVLAHVPDINDFVSGFAALLKPGGIATFEFPHLLRLLAENQFDTIYHEHYSYLSLSAVERIFRHNGLAVFDVESLPTHGGSLRVFAQRIDSLAYERSRAVNGLLLQERNEGMLTSDAYRAFEVRAQRCKDDFVRFLLDARAADKRVAAYGAAAKGNTFMNFAGVRPDLLCFVVDLNPAKQGKFMPGSRIPIVEEARIREEQPDYIVIFPWNIKAEIVSQLDYVREWGARFVTAVPELSIEA